MTTKKNQAMSVNESAKSSEKNYLIEDATIQLVITPPENQNRVSLILDQEFPTIDFITREEKSTNAIGINIYNLVQQIGKDVPALRMAYALALGQPVNPKIISMCLIGAKISVEREWHEKDSMRKTMSSDDTYSSDCYTSTIVKITPNIPKEFMPMIMELIKTEPAVVKTTGIVGVNGTNPFNW